MRKERGSPNPKNECGIVMSYFNSQCKVKLLIIPYYCLSRSYHESWKVVVKNVV
jgi:hypothetical protein